MTTGEQRAALERNLRLLPVHQALLSAFVWIPVGVLLTRARFDLDGAITLAALYYLFVVLLEVPSGWLSDRFGRVLTLRLAAASWVLAHTCFVFGGESFWAFVAAQFLMAGGFSALSGTDVSFHFDTLDGLGRAHEYQSRQARLASIGYIGTTVAVLVGGVLGSIDLLVPFGAALGLAMVQLAVAGQLSEPPVTSAQAEPLGRQLQSCLRYLRGRFMGWLFFYGIALVTLEHVAVTLLQPWLTEALGKTADDLGSTPLLSGVVFASVALIGAAAARASDPVARRFGVPMTLIGLGALSAVIVTTMAVSVHLAVLMLIAFRSVQGAAAPVLLSAAIAPMVQQRHRATFLSLNSLAGRLGYGLILVGLSVGAGDRVGPALGVLAVIAWSLVVLLLVTRWFVDSVVD